MKILKYENLQNMKIRKILKLLKYEKRKVYFFVNIVN